MKFMRKTEFLRATVQLLPCRCWSNVYSDAISIYWSGGYQLLPQTATLNVRGLAKKYASNEDEYSSPFEQTPPDSLTI